ncbi:MAG: hypothetical protein JNM78_07675 [Cyclobacteriaceae bacterium]|nr:hypothetical protein [Cyclobacteriaceae bacterium]
MTPFEYVTVLISIILGLGITQIVSGIADMVQRWQEVKLYWPHLLWIVFVFFLHIQEWWVLYEMRSVSTWMLPTFLFTILYPINLFILARILFPTTYMDSGTDFKSFYFDNFRKFFVWAAILVALSIADNLFVNDYTWKDQIVQLLLLFVILFIAFKNFRQEWLHKVVVLVLTVLLFAVLSLVEWAIKN